MQRIKFDETNTALTEVQFTSVSVSNLQTRLNSTTLPNANITCYIKRAGVTTAVLGTGTFASTDDTNALGVRGYRPSTNDRVVGFATLIFQDSGGLMEPREIPVEFVNDDPFAPAYYGALVSGTLTTTAFTTNLTQTTTDAWKDALIEFLSGPNAGSPKPIGGFTGTGSVGTVTLKSGYSLPATPTAGDKFRIITH